MNIPIFFDLELELVTKIRNAYAHNSGILLRVEKNEIERLARQIGGTQNDLTSFKIHKVEPNVYTIEFFSQYVDILIEKIEDSLYDILAQLRLRP